MHVFDTLRYFVQSVVNINKLLNLSISTHSHRREQVIHASYHSFQQQKIKSDTFVLELINRHIHC
jgi:hypothetical protein